MHSHQRTRHRPVVAALLEDRVTTAPTSVEQDRLQQINPRFRRLPRGTHFLEARDLQPANAVLDARAVYTVRRDGLEVVVRADESTTSDSECFRHEVSVEITRDGEPAWEKNWTVSVPRQWS